MLLALALLANLACTDAARDPGTVVYASGSDLESVNPLLTVHNLARQVQRHALFLTLARFDADLRAVPYAAEGWSWSADRRTLELRLHPGLRWHDGQPLTSADVRFTLDAARDPATGYARASDFASIDSTSAPDSATVAIHYAAPLPDFPPVLCELPILPAHRLAAVPPAEWRRGGFERAPVGAGPFRFAERRPGQRWVFVRNAEFPAALGGPPAIQRIVIAVVDEATTKFAGLVSGSLDVAGISPSMAALARQDEAIRVLEYPILLSVAIVLNAARPPFDDRRVREAFSLSIDRERIVDVPLAGFARPAAGPVADAHPYALQQPPARDTARADSLLEAAGWHRGAGGMRTRNGIELALELLTVGTADNAVEQLVQADAARRGVRLTIRQMEMGAFLAEARAGEKRFDALVTGVPGDLTLAYLAAMYDGRLRGSALDYGGFHSDRLDARFDAVRAAGTDAALREAWAEVQRELARETPAAWLYHARGLQGISARLRGVTMDLRGELATVADWYISEGASRSDAVAARVRASDGDAILSGGRTSGRELATARALTSR